MGSNQSTPPPPSPLLEKPWREINWSGKQDLQRLVKEFRPITDEVSHVRVLLYGPVCAGKSSFVNSVSTAIRGQADIQAQVNANNKNKSFTVQYKIHKIRKGGHREYYPFVFNDIMGLESGDDEGIRAEDIKLAMQGHIRDGYKFNPYSPLSESNTQFYNPSPSADDKVHLLVCVLNASSPEVKPSILKDIHEIRVAARDLGIPQVAIATHIDKMCEEVEKDVRNVFRSKYLEQKMDEFSASVGIPVNCIFPVKNYSYGVDPEDDMDALILTAFKHMLNFADDFIASL